MQISLRLRRYGYDVQRHLCFGVYRAKVSAGVKIVWESASTTRGWGGSCRWTALKAGETTTTTTLVKIRLMTSISMDGSHGEDLPRTLPGSQVMPHSFLDLIGMIAAGVATVGYAASGDYKAAAISALGLLPGGQLVGSLARGTRAMKAVGTFSAKLPGVGARRRLFGVSSRFSSGRGRLGWGKGPAHTMTFRVGGPGNHFNRGLLY